MNNLEEDIASAMPEAVPKSSGSEAAGSAPSVNPFKEELDRNIGALLELMTELKSDIQTEWDLIKEGEASGRDLKTKIKSELRELITLTIQQESKLHDFTSERAGKAGEYALDLGSARIAIRERLTCLRRAGGTDGVSGEPEPT